MIQCEALDVVAGDRRLVRAFTAAFQAGQVWAVLGRNGAGKSSLVHVLAGLAKPAAGRVQLDNRPLGSLSARERATRVGVLLQIEGETFWGTVVEYVLLGRFPHANAWSGYSAQDMAEATLALEALELGALRHRKLRSLSGGERQRARLAQVLAQSPPVLLLDEPLQHLDLAHQARVLRLMAARARERGDTVIMVLHEPLWIGRGCTHAAVFNGDGSVTAGPVSEVLTHDRLESAYGCELRLVNDGEDRYFLPHV